MVKRRKGEKQIMIIIKWGVAKQIISIMCICDNECNCDNECSCDEECENDGCITDNECTDDKCGCDEEDSYIDNGT